MSNFFNKRNMLTVFHLGLRILIAFVFIYAAYSKIFDPLKFSNDVLGYRILPTKIVNIMAVYLPWLELYCALFILIGIFLNGSLLFIGGMLLMFIVALSSVVIRGIDISCGCFGDHSHGVGWPLIIQDSLLLIGVVLTFKNDLMTHSLVKQVFGKSKAV